MVSISPNLVPVLLSEQVATMPDAGAVTDASGTMTWQQLAHRVQAWMAVLCDAGVGAGDVMGLMLGNRRETIEILLACLHSGVTAVPVNWHLTAPEVAYVLDDAGCRGLVVDAERAEVAAAAGVVAVAAPSLRLVTGTEPVAGFAPAEAALATCGAAVPAQMQTCGQLMLYTSGTTGSPKGVLNGLFQAGAPFSRVDRLLGYAGRFLGVPADGRILLVGPWYHSAQLFFALLPLLSGSSVVIRDRFDPVDTLATIERHRITECHLVPTQFVRLLRLPAQQRAGFDGRSLRRVWHGGAACAHDVKRQMIEWWGPVFVEYYAATEGGVVTLIDSEQWLRRPGSVGRVVPPNEILIIGADGEPLPRGQQGRVFVHRPGPGFRYHNAVEKTRQAHLRPGVFTYGEVGYLDDDGYLFLTGRAQEMIITGGVNVYPAEVEAVLLRHPSVRDAVVVGVPDEEYGERVAALVELDPQSWRSWAALDEHCRQSLAGFKVPRQYRAVASLPRESTGKIRKESLRGMWNDVNERTD